MSKLFYLSIFFICFFISNYSFTDEVVWKGEVQSDGTPTSAIDLTLDKKYQIIVSGTINLGKWVEAGKPLASDASFEFNAPTGPTHLANIKNSNDIPMENGTYHSNHIYKSEPFVAKQNKIHFWVHDSDYSDNTGAFDVKIVEIK